MKLDHWSLQFKILKINNSIPAECRWPNLERLLDLCCNIPLRSESEDGWGAFIGWATIDKSWVYHHAISVPSLQVRDFSSLFDFHDNFGIHSLSNFQNYIPIFNVGDIPESRPFAAALRKAGIAARLDSPAMSKALPRS